MARASRNEGTVILARLSVYLLDSRSLPHNISRLFCVPALLVAKRITLWSNRRLRSPSPRLVANEPLELPVLKHERPFLETRAKQKKLLLRPCLSPISPLPHTPNRTRPAKPLRREKL